MYRQKKYRHEGILNPYGFASEVDLRCYEPSLLLEPFVELYFVARWNRPGKPHYLATDILTKPTINMFFTKDEAYVNGVTNGTRHFIIDKEGMYAGVKFRPGAFHAFAKQSLSKISDHSPLNTIFPRVNVSFLRQLHECNDDQQVVAKIEELLTEQKPVPDKKIETVDQIITFIEECNQPLGTAMLAAKFHMSERSLHYLFSEYVGAGVKWTSMRIRLIKALQKSLDTSAPHWTKIAAELNYSTQSHFINDFRRLIGLSPSQYAKTILNPPPLKPQKSSKVGAALHHTE